MCNICGKPDYLRCECESAQPFCDQCEDNIYCKQKMDMQCVIYHFKRDTPSKLTNLGFNNGANLEEILEALDDLIGSQFNVPFEPEESTTIFWTAGGSAGHAPKAEVKLSADPLQQLEIRDDGLYAKPYNEHYKVKTDQADVPDFLENQIIGASSSASGGGEGIVSITVRNEGGLLKIIPSINLICLIDALRSEYNEAFCELVDSCKCLLSIQNLVSTFAPACPEGYVLNDSETLCVGENTTAPTLSEDVVLACPQFRPEYAAYGTLVYNGGFISSGHGEGISQGADIAATEVTYLTTPNVWQSDNVTGDNNGPINRAGIWVCPYTAPNTLGFVVPIDVPSTKTYYVGLAADNDFILGVNGVTVVDSSLSDGSYWTFDAGGDVKFKYWHIYPINLTEGINYLSLSAFDGGVQGMLAAEIYDNTLAELSAATLDATFLSNPAVYPYDSNHYDNLNLVFSTRCARASGTFSIGNATCPPGYNLDTSVGALTSPCQGINSDPGDWVCTQVITSPFTGFTGTVVWDRIPNAIEYQIQQKESADPDSAYVNTSTSNVANPGSGSTVSTVITGLPSVDMTFRVRAIFDSCMTDWEVVEPAV